MIRAVRRLTLSACLVALALVAVPAVASSGSNRVVGECTKSQTRPTEIVLACADGNAYVNHIHWTAFGGATARGTGTYVFNTCTPNCAAGTFKHDSVRFTATDARACFDMHDDYRVLALTFVGHSPFPTREKSFQLFCPVG
jgi:hypothetical protein